LFDFLIGFCEKAEIATSIGVDQGSNKLPTVVLEIKKKNPSFIFFILQDSVLRDRGHPRLQKTTVVGIEHDSSLPQAIPHRRRDMATVACE
jgi:hypothetical protein